ncbi:MAG TPA: iron-sulfur cluster assembly protein [Nitrososphaerales archaeon]|nr:iron-sulfur cluster assembly protein [Nitrososphaerales archaeon]
MSALPLKILQLPTQKEQLISMLKTCYDPEIPFNIVDLGLIYSLDLKDSSEVKVKMTLTSPGCPVGPWLTDEVRDACLSVEGIGKVSVEIVFDPPWNQLMMSADAHKALGI